MTDCTFCDIAAGNHPAHTVLADDRLVAFLDSRPVFKGHVLVVPRQHYVTLADLPGELLAPYFAAVRLVSAGLPDALARQLRRDQQRRQPERPAPSYARGTADKGGRAARLFLAQAQV